MKGSYQKDLQAALKLYHEMNDPMSKYGPIVVVDFVTGEVAVPSNDPNDPLVTKKNVRSAKGVIQTMLSWKTKDDPVVIKVYAQDEKIQRHLDEYLNRVIEGKGLKNELSMAQSQDGRTSQT